MGSTVLRKKSLQTTETASAKALGKEFGVWSRETRDGGGEPQREQVRTGREEGWETGCIPAALCALRGSPAGDGGRDAAVPGSTVVCCCVMTVGPVGTGTASPSLTVSLVCPVGGGGVAGSLQARAAGPSDVGLLLLCFHGDLGPLLTGE